MSSRDPASPSAAGTSQPGQFSLLFLLWVIACIAMFFGIVATFHAITGIDSLVIAGRILLLTAGFACALGGLAVLLGVICALERKKPDDQQEPIEATSVK